MSHAQYDLIILGGGPAGANLARRLDTGKFRVCLIDGADPQHPKPCGGLISPDAQTVLAKYGLSLPTQVLASPQLFSVRVIDLHDGLTRHYQRHYLNVDRQRFDRFLLDMVPPAVEVRHARCTRITRENGRYVLTLRQDGEEVTVSAPQLVGADGAGSLVRRTVFPHRRILTYTAIQQWFPAQDMNPYYSCLFDTATSPGCSWIFFKNDAFIFGGAFAKKNARDAFEAQKKRLIELGVLSQQALAAPQRTEACLAARPRIGHGVFRGCPGCFLIGEAAGFISPSSLEGISYALSSSEALAAALNRSDTPGAAFARYRRATAGLHRKVFFRCLKRPFMYRPLLRRLVMRSGLTAFDLFDRS
ncbi:MAG: FAD-binding protein [Clostridia bacterium]|nr:FAD-binding protein [Clostridia bacterium]